MERQHPAPRSHDWETPANRHRLLIKMFATLLGSLFYAALVFLAMAAVPPGWTTITGVVAYVLYLGILGALLWDEVRRRRDRLRQ